MGNSTSESLFNSFQKPSLADWLQTATSEIEGKNPLEALNWSSHGLHGKLFYSADDTKDKIFSIPPNTTPFSGPRTWVNLPRVTVKEENTANAVALDHLKNGADGVLFDLLQNNSPDIKKLLNNIEWPYCTLAFEISNDISLSQLFSFVQEKKWDVNSLSGFLLWENGSEKNKIFDTVLEFKNFYSVSFRTAVQQNVVDEIAGLLSNAVNYFANQPDISENSFSKVAFSVEADTDFFITIAKLKTLRWLWQKIVHAWGYTAYQPGSLHIHAAVPIWTHEPFNPHSNMLSTTTAALAAVCGGCNSLTVQAEDEFNPMMNRIARNVSSILREESHLDKVADPTAGSYYVDALVNQLAEQTWKKFSEHN